MSDPLQRSRTADASSMRIDGAPILVFSLETTGFPAGRHRICEVSLCRLAPDGSTELVFDSLVHPGRPMTGTEIHGLTDRDVEGAPRFAEIAADLLDAARGAVLASYNVTFGVEFLRDEMERCGLEFEVPHFCLMFLRPMLELGPRCSLEEACGAHGLEFSREPCSRADAETSTELLRFYRQAMRERGIETFADLVARGDFPFLSSLSLAPRPEFPAASGLPRGCAKRRVVRSLGGGRKREDAVRRYWQAVSAAVADYEVSEVELGLVRKMRELLDLPDEEMRAVHARAFMSAIVAFAGDDWLAEDERRKLRTRWEGLSSLGWTPGE